ncbi:MAG: hypothetical protein IJY27_06360 [Clostridia bacterium]|nr:hypothetical protein [Clostridia bacterium]
MKAEQMLIKQQAREIRRLRRENARLRRLADTAIHTGAEGDSAAELFASLAQNNRTLSEASYPRYIYTVLQSSSFYRTWMRILKHFRRFRLASSIIRAATWTVTVLQSGAMLIVAAAIFVVTIPIMLVTSLIAAISALTYGVKLNRRFEGELEGKRIYVFFPPASPRIDRDSVMNATINELARDPDNVIFAVSPHSISPYMFGKGKFYFTAKQQQSNVYYIRKYYYFMLRREILRPRRAQTRYIF